LSSASWAHRSTAALLMAALIFTLIFALLPSTHAPAPAPTARQATPAVHNPNTPITGTGSAYDGGAYVQERPAARNPNTPIAGTGSAYDGGAYVQERPAMSSPNTPITGTGSAYDGQ
jgi:hypothetical protein